MSTIINKASPGNNDGTTYNTSFIEDVPEFSNEWSLELGPVNHDHSYHVGTDYLTTEDAPNLPEFVTISCWMAPEGGAGDIPDVNIGMLQWSNEANQRGIAFARVSTHAADSGGGVWFYSDEPLSDNVYLPITMSLIHI